MPFTPEQVAILDANREVVEAVRLFHFALPSGDEFRLCEGNVPGSYGGFTWQPALNIISAPAGARGQAFTSIPGEYVIAGLPADPTDDASAAFQTLAMTVMQDREAWFGGTIHQFLQLLVDGNGVGPAISIHNGWIRDIVPLESATTALFKVTVESIFARRNRTPLGEYTDRDQKRRHPGDEGCGFVSTFALKTIRGWPF